MVNITITKGSITSLICLLPLLVHLTTALPYPNSGYHNGTVINDKRAPSYYNGSSTNDKRDVGYYNGTTNDKRQLFGTGSYPSPTGYVDKREAIATRFAPGPGPVDYVVARDNGGDLVYGSGQVSGELVSAYASPTSMKIVTATRVMSTATHYNSPSSSTKYSDKLKVRQDSESDSAYGQDSASNSESDSESDSHPISATAKAPRPKSTKGSVKRQEEEPQEGYTPYKPSADEELPSKILMAARDLVQEIDDAANSGYDLSKDTPEPNSNQPKNGKRSLSVRDVIGLLEALNKDVVTIEDGGVLPSEDSPKGDTPNKRDLYARQSNTIGQGNANDGDNTISVTFDDGDNGVAYGHNKRSPQPHSSVAYGSAPSATAAGSYDAPSATAAGSYDAPSAVASGSAPSATAVAYGAIKRDPHQFLESLTIDGYTNQPIKRNPHYSSAAYAPDASAAAAGSYDAPSAVVSGVAEVSATAVAYGSRKRQNIAEDAPVESYAVVSGQAPSATYAPAPSVASYAVVYGTPASATAVAYGNSKRGCRFGCN